jgi:hypothetical protein
MSFNLAKLKIIHVGPHNPGYKYFMRGTQLNTTEEERDIGVTVTSNVKPSVQCSKAARRVTAVLRQIRHIFHYCDRHTFAKLYKQYMCLHLEFVV